jgi:D-psicose/D-tagatose/L-ribulose 3-epimerase
MEMSNQIGVHFQVFTDAWTPEMRKPTLERVRVAGFDFIEITTLDPAGFDVDGTRADLDSLGLDVTLSTALSFESDISSDDAGAVARGERHLEAAVDAAAALDADWLVGLTYGAWGNYPAPPTARGRASCAEALGRICERAAAAGVSIGLEVINRYENNFLNTTAQALELVEEVGAPNLAIQLDSFHAQIEEVGQAEAVTNCRGRLGYLHVGENHRGMLGSGNVDFTGLFRRVVESGFQGPIAYEAFSRNVVGEEAAAALCVWRDLWRDSDALGAHAHRFISDQLRVAQAAVLEVRNEGTLVK